MPVPKSARDDSLSPYWQTTDEFTVRLYHGNALSVLQRMEKGTVHCCVTSPPYYGLRDYRTGSADELGAEATPEEYAEKLAAIFRQLKGVLRDDGTLWLNIGDTYLGNGSLAGVPWMVAFAMRRDGWVLRQEIIWHKPDCMTESVTDRCTRAHEQLFLFAKSRDYFYDRYPIRERASRAGHVPKGSKKEKRSGPARGGKGTHTNAMLCANEPVPEWRNKRTVWTVPHGHGYAGDHFAAYPPLLIEPCILAGTSQRGCCPECGAPWKRWLEKVRIPTRPGTDTKVRPTYHGATDGKGTAPVTTRSASDCGQTPHADARVGKGEMLDGKVIGNRDPLRHVTEVREIGWYPTCPCDGLPELASSPSHMRAGGDDGPVLDDRYREWARGVREECRRAEELVPPEELVPAVVLDPFIGSGTTALVALEHGRAALGIELSKDHLDHDCTERVKRSLLDRPLTRSLVPR